MKEVIAALVCFGLSAISFDLGSYPFTIYFFGTGLVVNSLRK